MNTVNWNIQYCKKVNYDIITTENIFDPLNDALLKGGRVQGGRRFIVIDKMLYKIYHKKLTHYFAHHGIEAKILPFAANEQNKTIESFLYLFKELDKFPIDRRGDPIIAIGGGVLTDVVGFVASTYRRGVPHIKVPTTLMGYVDASVGIKTGININSFKNRMGTFDPPRLVILDRTFIKALPSRHIINGMGEILKLAVIKDQRLFSLMEKYGLTCIESGFQDKVSAEILSRSITGMVEELAPNLYEDDLERVVDFGHTFSPALEMAAVDELLHGEAVAIDVVFSTILANVRSLISDAATKRVINLVMKLDLPYYHEALNPNLLWEGLVERTHHRDGFQRAPLPVAIGKSVFVNDISQEEINIAYERLKVLHQFKPAIANMSNLANFEVLQRG